MDGVCVGHVAWGSLFFRRATGLCFTRLTQFLALCVDDRVAPNHSLLSVQCGSRRAVEPSFFIGIPNVQTGVAHSVVTWERVKIRIDALIN